MGACLAYEQESLGPEELNISRHPALEHAHLKKYLDVAPSADLLRTSKGWFLQYAHQVHWAIIG